MVWWCPSVRPSVRPGLRLSVRPSVRHSFPHFSPTCFDILIWNFVYHFIFMHVRSSTNAINFRHFLQELCSFLTSNSYKYAVFRTFLLHALTYWVRILYMTLFECTTEQVWVSSFCFNFCWSYAPMWTMRRVAVARYRMICLVLRILEIHSFPHFSLTCFAILSWNFAHDFVLLYYRSSLSVVNLRQFLWELCPFWNSFPHFSLTCFAILSWNFAHDFVLLYYRSSSSVVNLRQFLWELCPFWNLKYWKYTVFRTFLLHPLTYWAESLHITLFYCTTDQVRVSSFCVYFGVMPLFELRVFCTFLLHALTYWAEILHVTLFYCTTGQLQVSLMGINFCRSNVPFET